MQIIAGPYLQNPHKTDITVMWETDKECYGEVRVCKASIPHVPKEKKPVSGEVCVYRGGTQKLHKIKVDGLCPSTDYYYEIISGCGEEALLVEGLSFRTAPQEDTAFSFILTAEEGGLGEQGLDLAAALHELIRRERPDFIQSVGDIVYNGTIDEDWNKYLFVPFDNILKCTPFYPCVGNHEVGGSSVPDEQMGSRYANYLKYFDTSRNYSYDYGCAHFCVLDCPSMFERVISEGDDSYVPVLKTAVENSPAYRFLEADLATSNAAWKFVVFHYPPYTSSVYDVRELSALTPIFEKYGVDIVFNSHAIVYERSHPIKGGKIDRDGVRYVLVGGHRDMDSWFRDKCSTLSAKIAARPNYVRVALTPWSLELSAVDYEGKLFDTLTLEKPIRDQR